VPDVGFADLGVVSRTVCRLIWPGAGYAEVRASGSADVCYSLLGASDRHGECRSVLGRKPFIKALATRGVSSRNLSLATGMRECWGTATAGLPDQGSIGGSVGLRKRAAAWVLEQAPAWAGPEAMSAPR